MNFNIMRLGMVLKFDSSGKGLGKVLRD